MQLLQTDHMVANRIAFLVELHVTLINLAARLNDIFAPYHLYYIVINRFMIAIALYNMVSSPIGSQMQIINGLTFLAMCIQMFWLFFFGQVLITRSEKVAFGVYDSGWECWESIPNKKKILIILINAQCWVQLSMYNFGAISMERFVDVS